MKAHSLRKFTNVSDMQVPDEDDRHNEQSRSQTITANNKIVKYSILVDPVTSKTEIQPLDSDTDAPLHDERIITVREDFKTARANVQEVKLEPRLRPTVASATREEHSH